jgi:hypothetical protein
MDDAKRYEVTAAAVYEGILYAEREASNIAAGYGKWLVASLLLINGGALFGLMNFVGSLAEHERWRQIENVAFVGWFFLAGLVLALGCGFSAWVNWSAISAAWGELRKPGMLHDREQWPKSGGSSGAISLTYWLAIILGWLSVLAAAAGTAVLIRCASSISA